MVAWGGIPSGRRGAAVLGLALLVVLATGVAAGVQGQPNVSVFAPENTVPPGETTQVELELMNNGTITEGSEGIEVITQQGDRQRVQTARNVTVEAGANGPPFEVETATVPVGNLAEGTSGPIPITLAVDEDADAGTYQLAVTVEYVYTSEIENGEETEVEETITEEVPIEIEEAARFETRSVQSDLAVGSDGEVTGTIENTGSEDANDAVLRLAGEPETLGFAEREYALGDVEAGESDDFAFDADVSAEASEGDRRLGFVVVYRDERGSEREATTNARVSVRPEPEEFGVTPVDTTVESGASGVVELEVANERDEPVRDVNAQIFADSPIAAENDEAYVDEIAPGESVVLAFEVSAEDGAMAEEYPLAVDFSYEDETGETRLSDRYQVPIEVVEPADDGVASWALGAVGVVLVVVGIAIGIRRVA